MPPSASSTRPRLAVCASVNAPFSCPNSSLSISVSGSAAQVTLMNGPDARRLSRCSACAIAPLPVPLSPSMITVAVSAAASRSISSNTARIAGPSPITVVPACRLPSRIAATSRRSTVTSSAWRTVATARSSENGFSR